MKKNRKDGCDGQHTAIAPYLFTLHFGTFLEQNCPRLTGNTSTLPHTLPPHTGGIFAHIGTFMVHFFRLLQYFGQVTTITRKLCLQPPAQRRQRMLYCRRPLGPIKALHSSRARLLNLGILYPLSRW
jgi:hypothetical protein